MEYLFVYGTLQPGGPNEHVLAPVGGEWQRAFVVGHLVDEGWGASMGYPALVLADDGREVHGQVFASNELHTMWSYLDEFEGEAYERTLVSVTLVGGGEVDAFVYMVRS